MPHTIEDVAHRLRQNKADGDSCVLLIGAGCSVSADIPLAAKFVSVIKDEFPREYERATVRDYPHCMGELTPTQRHRLISRYIDKAKINWAHIAIAQMMASGHVDRVLTTNFDPLVMRACAQFNIFPAVHDMLTLGEYRASRVRKEAVFHLHGQRDGFFQAHVKRDVDELEAKLAPLFQDCVNRRTWIVVGYSGDNDPVFRQLLNMRDFDHDLYWIGYRDTPMPPLLAPLMEEGRGGHWISGWDADNFLYQLADRVGCPEPPFFASPFTHLRQTLDSIASFKLPGQDAEVPVTQDAIAKIDKAIRCIEPGLPCTPTGTPTADATVPPPPRDLAKEARALLMAGKYDELVALKEAIVTSGSDAARKSLAWAYAMQGSDFDDQALTLTGDEADALWQLADEKYQQAIAIKPDMHEAFNNWGSAFDAWARTKTGDEADALWQQTCDKYQQAIAIKPDMHEPFYNWGNALDAWARTKTGDEADALWQQACDKYHRAIAIKPDRHEAFYNWGNALDDWARTKTGDEADALWQQACDKYHRAIAIKPDRHEAFNNWGGALDAWARTKTGDEADALWRQACDKYQRATVIKPDKHEAFYNWGHTLDAWAKTKSGNEAEALRRQACDKYQQAIAIKPDMHEAFNNWGNALDAWARTKTGDEADALWRQACDKYRQAVAIKPDEHDTFYNWGIALAAWARTKTGDEADALWREACDKFQQAIAINPDKHEAFYSWGHTLGAWAKAKSGNEAEVLWRQACDKYQQAIAIKPDDHEAFTNWGHTLDAWAKAKSGNEAQVLWQQACDKQQQANVLKPGFGSYNLACISALRGQPDECRRWLEDSRDHGRLPSRAHMESDTDLDSVRDLPWFQEILNAAK